MSRFTPKQRGDQAEDLVAEWLESQGIQVVARNLRLGMLEIDIVAREGDVVLVIEVRSRGSGAWTSAFSSIDGTKRKRIRNAGQRLWDRRYRNDASVSRLRYDAASVTFTSPVPTLEYVRGAF